MADLKNVVIKCKEAVDNYALGVFVLLLIVNLAAWLYAKDQAAEYKKESAQKVQDATLLLARVGAVLCGVVLLADKVVKP